MDKSKFVPKRYEDKGHYIRGDFGNAPFRDGFFDALYYQDNHADLAETADMLRTLRRGGIIIYSNDSCYPECIDVNAFAKISGIIQLILPFANQYYTAFKKL